MAQVVVKAHIVNHNNTSVRASYLRRYMITLKSMQKRFNRMLPGMECFNFEDQIGFDFLGAVEAENEPDKGVRTDKGA